MGVGSSKTTAPSKTAEPSYAAKGSAPAPKPKADARRAKLLTATAKKK